MAKVKNQTITFEKSPVLEIIAELRWNSNNPMANNQVANQTMTLFYNNNFEEMYKRFSDKIAGHDYVRSERLIPQNFPASTFQPVYRFKKVEAQNPTLIQIGEGLISIHALPPYQSWVNFSPDVSNSINAILESRNDSDKNKDFSKISLRYINIFYPELLQGNSVENFIENILCFKIITPDGISKHQISKDTVTIQLSIKSSDDLTININVGKRNVNNSDCVLLDFIVESSTNINTDHDEIMGVFNKAHDLIHRIFIDITEPIHQLMKVKE